MSGRRLLVGIRIDGTVAAEPRQVGAEVLAAERRGLNFVLFGDAPGAPARWNLDPIECASFTSATTRAIGLIATAAVTHAEPFHLSNRLSGLDWGSSGRAGWLAAVDASAARAAEYSAAAPDPLTARREAGEVVDAARRLWDSWEDGALIADTETGRFLDQEKLHYVDVESEFFSIRGPALMPRPVQGQVPVFARAPDQTGYADVTLSDGLTALDDRSPGLKFAELALLPGAELLPVLRRLAGSVGGVVLRTPEPVAALEELDRHVIPALAAEGIPVPPRPGETLRAQLGLPRPSSRYAAAAGGNT